MNTVSQFFKIHPEEKPLIDAAIKLGDWLADQPETTESQQNIIRDIQSALRKLPEAVTGLSAEYGFSATSLAVKEWDGSEPAPKGEERSWHVEYYQGMFQGADSTR